MPAHLTDYVLKSPTRLAMPIGVYAGLPLTGATIQQVVSDPHAQTEAIQALDQRFHSDFLLTAMDLSVEAEIFGCAVRWSENEIPSVAALPGLNLQTLQNLPTPQPRDGRTRVQLETVSMVAKSKPNVPVIGGMIGPFSLAGRLFGVSQLLEATLDDPEFVHALIARMSEFLLSYACAFREAGAQGVVMAEPAAGLLSPRGLETFSSRYVQKIVTGAQTSDFSLLLHNCGAKIAHFPKVLLAGAEFFHFGAPMDLAAAFLQTPNTVVLAGNLDPTAVFFNADADEVHARTLALLETLRPYPNYVISSGCDLPPGTPLENIKAFYEAVRTG